MRTIQPTFCKVTGGHVRLIYSILDLPVLFVMLLSEIVIRKCTLYILPPFEPNDEMLELHADKGEEDWEIYAWCLRDVIAKAADLEKKENNEYKERNAYFKYINGRCDINDVYTKLKEGSQAPTTEVHSNPETAQLELLVNKKKAELEKVKIEVRKEQIRNEDMKFKISLLSDFIMLTIAAHIFTVIYITTS